MSKRFIPTARALDQIDDRERFAKLVPCERERVLARIDWIMQISGASHGEKGELIQNAAQELKTSVPTLSRLARRFKKSGWQALCDNRGRTNKPLPELFKDFVRQLHLQCQRATSGREVHRMLVERWRKWQRTGDEQYAIPGYETPPPAGPKGYPAGWSEDNVLRFRPDEYALAVARQGSKRAVSFLPSILKTRVGMRFGSVVFFDDQAYDATVAPRGASQQAIRPQGFNCLDYLSGCFMHHAIRLRWWDKEGDQFRTLTQTDFTWFVISYRSRRSRRSERCSRFSR